MTIGILTAGGDCPGLNAVIRAVGTRAAHSDAGPILGFRNGWQGLVEGDLLELDREAVRGILGRGGTILGTSRYDPFVHGSGIDEVRAGFERHGLSALVVVGGDGTIRTARLLDDAGLPIIAVPKTIDNDIPATDVTFGFDTAVQIATDAVDRLTTTAEAHHRVMLVEVMGRTRGWIALHAGMASGADVILIPEHPLPLPEAAEYISTRDRTGHHYSVVVVAEGYPSPMARRLPVDDFGFERLGGVAYAVAPVLEDLTGFETRVTVLGHLQRGGTPTAFDRVLATRLGVAAADLALAGRHGLMVAVRGEDIVPVAMSEACIEPKGVPADLYDVARTMFG
ncbi:MAG: ATP-dependent 6-phosphofructokinase [Acidimicrobiia bacterium]|nr:MAG: ATP-dependent 6-phosphofructokinase [Acidimicrobiia bacterium]